jgi:glycine/D-amino acid oxidase-like deaminating enzyme
MRLVETVCICCILSPCVLQGVRVAITTFLLNIPLNNGFILEFGLVICQLEKVEGGIKVTTDKGEVFEADAVMFATGNSMHFVCHMFHIQNYCCFELKFPQVSVTTVM